MPEILFGIYCLAVIFGVLVMLDQPERTAQEIGAFLRRFESTTR